MAIFVVLALIVVVALFIVSITTRLQKRQQLRRLQQRQLRLQLNDLNDLIECLEQTLPNPKIALLFNQRAIDLLIQMQQLEDNNPGRIHSLLVIAKQRTDRLSSLQMEVAPSYQRASDVQMAKCQNQLQLAISYLPSLVAQGKIHEIELAEYQNELRWAHLMVAVMSYIGQGKKCLLVGDRFAAQAYFRKAQQPLLESSTTDSRRLKLIKEISELIEGSRPELSREFQEPAISR